MPAFGAMRLRAFAICLALLASLQAAAAQPSVTPGITVTASGSGDVTAGPAAVVVTCTVTNPAFPANPYVVAPSGYVYFVGVSTAFSFCTSTPQDFKLVNVVPACSSRSCQCCQQTTCAANSKYV